MLTAVFNLGIADSIVEWLWSGRSLLAYCRQDGVPQRRTIYDWAAADEEFGRQFKAATKGRGALLMELAQEIADATRPSDVGVAKLRIDQLNRRAACYDPAGCGTKVQLGGDGGEPIRVVDKGDEVKELASILALAAARKE